MTGAVTHLVAQSPHMITSKMQKAIDAGVTVVGEEWLYRPDSAHDVELSTTRANSIYCF